MSNDASGPAFSRGREWVILFVLAAVQFTSIVDFMVVMPLGPQLSRELSLTPPSFGLIVSSYTYAAGIAGIFATIVVDHFARRTAFLAIFAGFLLGTGACGLAPTYEWLLTARVLTGAFGGILGGMAMAIVGDVFHEKRRGTATGVLMTAFALASTFGVPIGLTLGQKFGWHVPFLALALLGVPVLILAAIALPRLDAHLSAPGLRAHSLIRLLETFSDANHLRAFALTVSLMFGAFCVFPYFPEYLVTNVGIEEESLLVIYITGGVLVLVGAPICGRLADVYGKLLVFRVVAPIFAGTILLATMLPPSPLFVAAMLMAAMMLSNAGRMVPALAMITSSVAPERRGGFLGANSAVQHIAAGLGASVGGAILTKEADGTFGHYPLVGLVGAAVTLVSVWLAGRLRTYNIEMGTGPAESLAAAAQGTVDASEPITVAEM